MRHFDEKEQAFIRYLAESYEGNERHPYLETVLADLHLDKPTLLTLLTTMQEAGIIRKYGSRRDGVIGCEITSAAVEYVREFDAQAAKQPDHVERAESWMRSNPWLARAVIALVVLTFLATVSNQIWSLLLKAGWVAKAP